MKKQKQAILSNNILLDWSLRVGNYRLFLAASGEDDYGVLPLLAVVEGGKLANTGLVSPLLDYFEEYLGLGEGK